MKLLINSIRLGLLNKLLRKLCNCSDCRNCPAYLKCRFDGVVPCAQYHVIEQALKEWGLKDETYSIIQDDPSKAEFLEDKMDERIHK